MTQLSSSVMQVLVGLFLWRLVKFVINLYLRLWIDSLVPSIIISFRTRPIKGDLLSLSNVLMQWIKYCYSVLKRTVLKGRSNSILKCIWVIRRKLNWDFFLCYFEITSKNCPRTCNYSITFKSTIAISTSKSLSNAPALVALLFSGAHHDWQLFCAPRDWPLIKKINCSWQGLRIKLRRIFLGADFSPSLLNYLILYIIAEAFNHVLTR